MKTECKNPECKRENREIDLVREDCKHVLGIGNVCQECYYGWFP